MEIVETEIKSPKVELLDVKVGTVFAFAHDDTEKRILVDKRIRGDELYLIAYNLSQEITEEWGEDDVGNSFVFLYDAKLYLTRR